MDEELNDLGYGNILNGVSDEDDLLGAGGSQCGSCTGGCMTCSTCQSGNSVQPPSAV